MKPDKMERALREILFARKPGPTPKLIDGALIERIEKIAAAALSSVIPATKGGEELHDLIESLEAGCQRTGEGDNGEELFDVEGATDVMWQAAVTIRSLAVLSAPYTPTQPTEVSEEELCKVLVKIWGYKWVEFEDIPLPGAEGRDRIAEAYSARLNAQDAVRGLLRRYIIQPQARTILSTASSTGKETP